MRIFFNYCIPSGGRSRRKTCSALCTNQLKSDSKISDKNPNWLGNKVGYAALHIWVAKRLGVPDRCSKCGKVGRVDLANKSQEYKRDVLDWDWLCRRCHMLGDGRMDNLLAIAKERAEAGWKIVVCLICKKEKSRKRSYKGVACSQLCASALGSITSFNKRKIVVCPICKKETKQKPSYRPITCSLVCGYELRGKNKLTKISL